MLRIRDLFTFSLFLRGGSSVFVGERFTTGNQVKKALESSLKQALPGASFRLDTIMQVFNDMSNRLTGPVFVLAA